MNDHAAIPHVGSANSHELLAVTVRRRIKLSIAALRSIHDRAEEIAVLIESVRRTLHAGGLLATAGNGGSAAEALHLAEELVGRYRATRRPYRAVCLAADPTALTCIANDFGFDAVFARQAEALLNKGDALLVLSTSGNSPNLVRALEVARQIGATTIGMLGRDGGACRALCDVSIVVPTDDSANIQEAHQVIMHLICEALEPAEPTSEGDASSPDHATNTQSSAPVRPASTAKSGAGE